jgi:hypothetical protein
MQNQLATFWGYFDRCPWLRPGPQEAFELQGRKIDRLVDRFSRRVHLAIRGDPALEPDPK